MAAFPKARRNAPQVELDQVTKHVWQAADGATSVAAIAERLGVGRETVWAALDRLADLDLLEQRAGPPAGLPTISRRAALGLAGAGAAGLGVVAAALPAAAAAKESAKKQASEEEKKAPKVTTMSTEQGRKAHERSVEEHHKSEARATEVKDKKAAEQKRK